MFVGVEDEQEAPGEFVTQFNRVADPRVGPGALLCLDATNGDLKWAIRTDRSLVPRIAGDPTDVMVLWTQHRPSFRSRGEERRDTMNVRIIDGTSGRLMATASSLSTATPFRCAHAADEKTIRLFTRDTEITFRPGAAD